MDYKQIFNEANALSLDLFPDYFNRHRERAFEIVDSKGFPDSKTEKYKYTPLVDVFSKKYKFYNPYNANKPESIMFPRIDAIKLYTINGVCIDNILKTEEGYTYGSLSRAVWESEETVSKYYNSIADNTDTPTAMNTATALSGVFVSVNPGVTTTKPLIIINISDSRVPVYSQLRNLFVFGENSSANVIIYNVGLSELPLLSNDVSEVIVEKNAQVDIVRVHERDKFSNHISSDYHRQYKESTLNLTNVILGGALLRQNTEVHLAGKHCYNSLYGLIIGCDQQHTDNYTFIDHAVSDCHSNELYKSILNDNAVNVFNGRILVREDAQKTLAFQSNRNILLNNNAKMYTKPQLEIYADDVKCSHGATIGQLNEDALYYMQSRGISEKTAQLLLMSGFANEALGKIGNEHFYNFMLDKVEKALLS